MNKLSPILVRQRPVPALNEVVDEYVFRRLSVQPGNVIVKQMPSRPVTSIDFFLAGSYKTFSAATQQLVPFVRSTIRGPRTFRKFRIEIDQDFCCFSIRFKPAGIFQLLGIPMTEFCDQAIDAQAVMPAFSELTEQLLACTDIQACRTIVEPFLLKQLASMRHTPSSAMRLANVIKASDTAVRIKELYRQLPVASRHLERNFVKEVGVTPKMYSNLIRFEKVIQLRQHKPQDHWSSIACELNYFDQMHLIKDFKRFLDITPSSFQHADFAF